MFEQDEIHVASLELSSRIGVTDKEREHPQRLTVSLILRPQRGFTGLGDEIERTINYSSVCAAVREMSRSRPRRLIETLAEEIALGVLATFAECASVDVELRKYVLADTDYVAVRLSRSRT